MKELIEKIIAAYGYKSNGDVCVRVREDQVVITINHEEQLVFTNKFYNGWVVTTEAIEEMHCDIDTSILLCQTLGRNGYLVENCQRVRQMYEAAVPMAEAA